MTIINLVVIAFLFTTIMEIKEIPSDNLSKELQEWADFQAYWERAFQLYFNELFGAVIALNDRENNLKNTQ